MCTECGCHGHSHVNLDDLAHLKQHDPDGMLDLTIGLTEQIRKAVELARVVDLPASYGQVKNVIGTGMGGSGIGGAFCAQLFQDVLTVPMASNRDYTLPAYAGPDTLVIAGSYSGNTEETLTAAAEAQRRGCKVFCVTGGGELLAFAEKHGLPYAKVPTGLAPRAAAGYMFVPQVFALQKAGLIPDQTAAFEEAIALLGELLETWRPESKLDDNPTKQLAEELFGHIPLIYGEFGYLGVIAERWKDQINENSKVIAYNNVLPELNHNEVVGWELPEELAEVFSVVLLRDEDCEYPVSASRRGYPATRGNERLRRCGSLDSGRKPPREASHNDALWRLGEHLPGCNVWSGSEQHRQHKAAEGKTGGGRSRQVLGETNYVSGLCQ